jgi:proteic killer suppression protein
MPIAGFRHKGLKALFEHDETSGVQPQLAKRLKRMLAALDRAKSVAEIESLPGWRLHPLKGDFEGFWSLSVSGIWRLVFRFEEGDALDLDLIDYH